MTLPLLNSLYGRIFAIFWLSMFLAVVAVLALPYLDPRKARDIPELRYQKILDARDKIETKLSNETDVNKIIKSLEWAPEKKEASTDSNKPKDSLPRWKQFFLADTDGNILTTNTSGLAFKAARNFATIIDRPVRPQQKLYGKWLISGPIPIHLADQNFLLYECIQWDTGHPLYKFVFDSPFRLLFAVMLVSTPFLLWLSWTLSQPARRLEKAAELVSKGVFEIDPKLVRGTTEFKKAGLSFNLMVESINHMLSRQQRLLSDISHELRSPLTRLCLAHALAVRKMGNSKELERIDIEAQRLEQMISKLLDLSRMNVDSHLNRQKQLIQSLWEGVLYDSQFEAQQIGKEFVFNKIPDRHIVCCPDLLISALENIVRNAIYYGESFIQVTFEDKGELLRICVEDNGVGVPDDEIELIFRPFYRVSESRDRYSGGTGLGLAIMNSAVRQHNGTIRAGRSKLGGLMIEIFLPLVVN